MQWTDEGLVLGTRSHGEASVILELYTRNHGRHLGLVRGGRSRRLSAALQPGNSVQATWQARLDEHLGTYAVEPTRSRVAALIDHRAGIAGVTLLSALARLLPERDPHPGFYEALLVVADALDDPTLSGPLMVRLELAVLEELGFGLDLSACAATGDVSDLVYVSPKTGRAVSAGAGAPYAERLLPLPAFLVGSGSADQEDVEAGFVLTGHFLDRHVFEPRGLPVPEARGSFIAAVTRRRG